MSEPTPYWPPPPTAPIGPDLTPTHTALQTLRTFHAQHEIDVLLDASFAAYGILGCGRCGRMAERGYCAPCEGHNAPPIYSGSFVGQANTPVPGDALRAVEAVWITPGAQPCHDCAAVADRSEALAARVDDLLDQNDAQAIENSDLARQVVSLKGHLAEMAAQVRQGKLGAEGA